MNMFEIFVSLLLLSAGVLTLAFRNRRNVLVGFRIGYTWHSEKAWKKANTFAGLFSIAYSVVLLILAVHGIKITIFIVLMIFFVTLEVIAGTLIARREYEIEELSKEAPEKPESEINTSMKPYIVAQLVALAVYLLLVALLWNHLPHTMATHFGTNGKPNGYSGKLSGALVWPIVVWVIPFTLTVIAREPAFFARVALYPANYRVWGEFTTVMSWGLILISSMVLLYNVKIVSSTAITCSTIAFLAAVGLVTYRLIAAGIRGR